MKNLSFSAKQVFFFMISSQNYLPVGEEMQISDDAFITVSHLTMGRMKYDWCTVLKCLTVFPSIRKLIASYNIIKTIDCVPLNSNILQVTNLSLENNLISDWNEVLKLGKLPWFVITIQLITI